MHIFWSVCSFVFRLSFRPRKVVLFPEIGRVNIFYHSPGPIVECVSEYIFLIKKLPQVTRRPKAKETKEEKRISVANLMVYDDIVCKFALCAFNLLDRDVNCSWLLV